MELSERDIKAHRTIHHPDYCYMAYDDCWGAELGYPFKRDEDIDFGGEDYCKQCEFYHEVKP